MAPTRGLRRAIVAAATIIAVRGWPFSVRQPSESKPKPAPVRTPPVRAPPAQNTTDAPPPPRRKKVAVFYNVYARPRPQNQSCTSSKTWHKAGEPDKNCAWIGSSNNKQVTARRCRTASRVAAEVCGCECANVTTDLAVGIVDEQLKRLRNRPLWSFISRIYVATIGSQAAVTAVMERCAKLGRKCVHIGHARTGDETNSLTPLHEYCATHEKAAVAYLHNKGSFHDSPSNARLRRVLLRGLSSKPCADAIASGSDQCDVCSMRFSPVPHQHVSGNMWLARCDYVRRLHEPRDFRRRMNAHWNWTELVAEFNERCAVLKGAALRDRRGNDLEERTIREAAHRDWTCDKLANATVGSWLGVGRFAYEHWVHSHPAVRPCDVLDHPFHYGYENLPPEHYRIRLAPAPRYRPGHPYYKFGTINGNPCGSRERSTLEAVLGEWTAIYGSNPPADSRLLARYMTPPPEAPPVKLRRKIEHDAGGAFRRWARRRGKGAPRRDSGATYCGQRPGRPRQREAVSPGRLVQVNCTAS